MLNGESAELYAGDVVKPTCSWLVVECSNRDEMDSLYLYALDVHSERPMPDIE